MLKPQVIYKKQVVSFDVRIICIYQLLDEHFSIFSDFEAYFSVVCTLEEVKCDMRKCL